ncbi:TaqI-like C-terminal specificity domain-containing protein [Spirosoma aerolatum]|uniref:TaqI-like C-terminal specificity domain-containing protein n=1 Tax=Spirosoma aerolatum TaxID=1211326 RepID=UPI0009AD7161|nr:TaqI-like C-terminal specificity domain-containing protein [Spirosoma aerolatum]
MLSEIEQRIKAKIEAVGTPLKDWDIAINYGIKTGFNDAFIIDGAKRAELLNEDPKSAEVIRPILRGRDIKRYGYDFADLWLINIHNGIKEKGIRPIIISDYPAIKRHLDKFWPELEKRLDKGLTPYNLRNCAYIEDFNRQKIVWGNLNLSASYAIAEEGLFVNAPCPMIVPASKYLLAILNSEVADYYIRKLGVTRNGGYFEYKPMFIEQLPVPLIAAPLQQGILDQAERLIEKVGKGESVKQEQQLLNEMIFQLYSLTPEEIEFIEQSQHSQIQ